MAVENVECFLGHMVNKIFLYKIYYMTNLDTLAGHTSSSLNQEVRKNVDQED
jgi:hypothetical protein